MNGEWAVLSAQKLPAGRRVCVRELVLAVAATPPKRNQVLGAAPILCSGVPEHLGAMCWCSSAWELWFAHTSPGLGWYQDLQIPAGMALRPW